MKVSTGQAPCHKWLWVKTICHFGVGAPPILVYFGGDWDVHWEYGVLTHGQIAVDIRLLLETWFWVDR